MKTEHRLKTIGQLIIELRLWLMVLSACLLVCALIMHLYRMPPEGIAYALLICLVLAAIFAGAFVSHQVQRHQALSALKDALPESLEHLPPPQGQWEQDYQDMLHHLAGRYTRQITQSDRQQARTREVFTTWSHQIKTPLSAMRLMLEDEDTALARAMRAEALKIDRYVDLALNYLRLEGPDSDFLFRDLSLSRLVSKACRGLSVAFLHKRLRLSVQVPEEALVRSDEKWLGFVLDQLLQNAVKYTDQGGISIHWNQGKRQLVMADTGCGIEAEDLPRVFEHGYTGYQGRIDQRATGLGLYLCREITRRMGHELSIESTPGEGTRVLLTFPQAKQEIE